MEPGKRLDFEFDPRMWTLPLALGRTRECHIYVGFLCWTFTWWREF